MPEGLAKLRARTLTASVLVHAAILVVALRREKRIAPPPEPRSSYGAYVVFRSLPRPAGPAGPAPKGPLKTTHHRLLQQPRKTPDPLPPLDFTPDPRPEPQVEAMESFYPQADGNAVAGPGGTGLGASGAGGGGGGPPGAGARNFDEETMIAPHRLSGRNPSYTYQALLHAVQGVMLVGCHVGVDGRVSACRVLQSLPFMDGEAIAALESCRYAPARLADGTPVAVDYIFRIVMRLKDA